MLKPRPSIWTGLPRLPASPFQRAVFNTPADRTGACVDCFPARTAFPEQKTGRRLHQLFRGLLGLHSRYGPLDILAVHRQGENLRSNFDEVRLAFGDTLLLEGPPEGLRRLFDRPRRDRRRGRQLRPVRQSPPTDGLSRPQSVGAFQWRDDPPRPDRPRPAMRWRGPAWSRRLGPTGSRARVTQIIRDRMKDLPEPIRNVAWKAQSPALGAIP